MQGLWLSSLPDLSRKQIDGAIALAKRYPDVIQSVIVGNEVLLRGEMSAPQLAAIIREVKAQVPLPVTYADVWEFWLRNRELAARSTSSRFTSCRTGRMSRSRPASAARHVDAIRRQVADAFPGKEILIGEFGWPSAGRMREGALPSPANQARALHDVMALAKREGFRVNLIEAYDQPWKRQLEGTVGGHWGLFDAYLRKPKFVLGRRGLQSSELALAGGRGRRARGDRSLRAGLAACRRSPSPSLRVWLASRGECALCPGSADRVDASRTCRSKASPRATGLRSLAWAARRGARAGRWRGGAGVGGLDPELRARAGASGGRARPIRWRSRSARCWSCSPCWRCRPRSGSCSIRATATFRSRRSPRPSCPSCA